MKEEEDEEKFDYINCLIVLFLYFPAAFVDSIYYYVNSTSLASQLFSNGYFNPIFGFWVGLIGIIGEIFLVTYLIRKKKPLHWIKVKLSPLLNQKEKLNILTKIPYEYDFAISFAGEVRETAQKIANLLIKKGARVFYDKYNEAEMVGKKLSGYFSQKFGSKTRFMIILISKDYPMKGWTNFEYSIARDEAKVRREEFILPIRLDKTKVFGIHDDVCYIDLNEKSIEETVNILLEKLRKKDQNMDNVENHNNKYYQAKAQELLLKVNNKEISISVILPEYYDFLGKINEKKEVQWVEAELSGNISELGKDHPEYFEYRKIKGYISPNELVSAGIYSLDMIAANEESLMFKHEYIPSISIHELERFSEKSTGFGRFTLSKKYMDAIEVDVPGISEFYFYFNPSGVIRIITNIRSKISAFLVQYIRK